MRGFRDAAICRQRYRATGSTIHASTVMSFCSADQAFDTLVIGAGQAGLATGYYLKKAGRDFLILGSEARVGDTWRNRWDSLRLFTPARYSSLPGMPFPGQPDYLPSKDEVGDYLERYAERFALPVRLNSRVSMLMREGDGFMVHCDDRVFAARNVIVATGAFQKPRIPAFASQLRGMHQLHSSRYQGPHQLPSGSVLVVGAGNSGAQIALELSASRDVWLSGPDVGRLPRRLLGRDIYTWLWPTILQVPTDSNVGDLIKHKRFASADPLIGVDLTAAPPSLHRVGRTVGVQDGRPVLEEGKVLDVSTVIWCTGYVPDFEWIRLDIFDSSGHPRHTRGIVDEAPGLYFVGLRFLSRMKSSLIGGVGIDAAYVVDHLRKSSVSSSRQRRPLDARVPAQPV